MLKKIIILNNEKVTLNMDLILIPSDQRNIETLISWFNNFK